MKKFAFLAALALGISYVASSVTVKWEEPKAEACERGVDC